MAKLSKTWLTDRIIDAEYKNYLLLAYLREVHQRFDQRKLYPDLSDLIEYYREASALQQSSESVEQQFPRELSGIDLENFRLMYEKLVNDDSLFAEILLTIRASLPQLEEYIRIGRQIYEYVEERLLLEPIGLVPLNVNDGYLLVANRRQKSTDVFEFRITLFETSQDKFRAVRTEFITSYPTGIHYTYEFIKTELIRYRTELPNPVTYAVEPEIEVPVYECCLPIAKRMLVRRIDTSA